ncbi:MAG: DUF4258 domain-containing protein [Nitrospira sp.]|nr:DUF4258 domain-containing protein [Nitrospira sp.]
MLERLRALIRTGRYRITLHAEQERDADQITIDEIEQAYSGAASEIIEDYPDDPRGHSALVLAFTESHAPLHAVWSIHENTAILITIYRPDPKLWTNWRKRKGRRS